MKWAVVQLVQSAEAPRLAEGQAGLCCPVAELRGKCGDELLNLEGLPVEVNPVEYFDYEIVCFGADTSPRFPVKVVEETEESHEKTSV